MTPVIVINRTKGLIMATKAAAVREYLGAHPDAKAKEVIDALALKKIKVLPAQVYGLMSARPVKKLAAKNGNGFSDLIQAKKLVDSLGGVDNAKAALNVLAQLLG